MKKDILSILRTSLFVLTVITIIPLFIKYITGQESSNTLIIDLHVWFGLAFVILATVSMIKKRK